MGTLNKDEGRTELLRSLRKEEVLKRVARSVAGNIGRIPKECQTELRSELRGSISGFRDILEAPPAMLALQMGKLARNSDATGIVVLKCWTEINSELVRTTTSICEKMPDATRDHQELSIDRVCQENSHFDRLDVELAVAFYKVIPADATPYDVQTLSPEVRVSQLSSYPTRLVSWLNELGSLSGTSEEWSHVEWFVAEVEKLASHKSNEKERQRRRTHLTDALAALLVEPAMRDLPVDSSSWLAANCPESSFEHAITLIADLSKLISIYNQVISRKSTSIAEKSRHLFDASDLVKKMEGPFAALTGLLEPPESTLSRTSASEEPAAGENAAPQMDSKTSGVGTNSTSIAIDANRHEEKMAGPKAGSMIDDVLPRDVPASVHDEPLREGKEGATKSQIRLEQAEPKGDRHEPDLPVSGAFHKALGPEESIASIGDAQLQAEDTIVAKPETGLNRAKPKCDQREQDPVPGTTDGTVVEMRTAGSPATANGEPKQDVAAETTAITGLRQAEHGIDLIWNLMEKDDVAGAYWLARAREENRENPVIPSTLLAAVAGSKWLTGGAPVLESDVVELVQSIGVAQRSPFEGALRLSAALVPAITHPGAGTMVWLRPLAPPFDAFNAVTEVVQRFSETGLQFRIDDVRELRGQATLEREVNEVSDRARQWLKEANYRTFKYARATEVSRHLTNPAGGFALTLLGPVLQDQRQAAPSLLSDLSKWRGRKELVDLIRQVEREHPQHPKPREIEARALDQLISTLQEAARIASDWCYAVQQCERSKGEKGWLSDQIGAFVAGLQFHAPSARTALQTCSSDSDLRVRAVAKQLLGALSNLEGYSRGIPLSCDLPPSIGGGLSAGLSFRLLWHPALEIASDAEGMPCLTSSSRSLLPTLLERDGASTISVQNVLYRWLELNDFRWVEYLVECVQSENERAQLTEKVFDARNKSKERFRSQLGHVQADLEQAVLEGTIDLNTRAGFESELEQARVKAESRTVCFGEVAQSIKEVAQHLAENRDRVLDERRSKWDKQLLRSQGILDKKDQKRLSEAVNNALKRRDIYLADEILASLDRSLDARSRDAIDKLFSSWQESQAPAQDELKLFLAERDRLLSIAETPGIAKLEQAAREQGNDKKPVELADKRLPEPRWKEIAQTIAAWRTLKQMEEWDRKDINLQLYTLIRYLGFGMRPDSPAAFIRKAIGRGWSHWVASIVEPISPVAQFGSGLTDQLNILCLGERPGLLKILTIVKEANLGDTPLIVLYLGRHQSRQWEEWVRFSQEQHLQALLFDETLLLFLARQYESRFPAFLQCALPATIVNPFVPFAAGNVPKEMFFGREDVLHRLQEPLGPAIVYGGRQLGKSSLLRQLQRRFHDPGKEQYSFYQDIKHVGATDSLETPEGIWLRIMTGLTEAGLVGKTTSTRPEYARQQVGRLMQTPGRKILALFDEADAFLVADAQRDFSVLSSLKALMESTGRRFKVVFAGLHNVRRFSAIPNQPLAHLGTPINVGPLSPRDARDLIRMPMHAIGMRFPDDTVVLRILSLTNYHPGLIQLFCHRLIDRVKTRRSVPPYEVTMDDVESTYRNAEVRSEIKHRFVWTLDLDPHYGVITRSMVIDQMEQPGGFALSYSCQELTALSNEWWNKGFRNVSMDHFRDYVDELQELGILASSQEGRVRLRSPNVARLLGTKEDIESWLEKYLFDAAVVDHGDNVGDQTHPRVQKEPPVYSPLTKGQLSRMGMGRSGVNLVFGSRATGLDRIPLTLDMLTNKLWGTQLSYEHIEYRSEPSFSLEDQIRRKIRQATTPGILLSTRFREGTERILEQIRAIARLTEESKPDSWARIVFLIGPEAMPGWFELGKQERGDLDTRFGAAYLGRCTKEAIQRWLEDQDMPADEGLLEEVSAATGGYWCLMERYAALLRQHKSKSGSVIASELRQELSIGNSSAADEFRVSLGLADDLAIGVYRGLCQLSEAQEFLPSDEAAALVADEKDIPIEAVLAGIAHLESLALVNVDGANLVIESLARNLLAKA